MLSEGSSITASKERRCLLLVGYHRNCIIVYLFLGTLHTVGVVAPQSFISFTVSKFTNMYQVSLVHVYSVKNMQLANL